MDVRRAQFEGVHDDLVHEPDERRVGFHSAPSSSALPTSTSFIGQFLDHVLERAVGHRLFFRAVIFVQRRLDVRLGSDLRIDFRAEQMRQRINGVEVGGIGEGDRHLVVRS